MTFQVILSYPGGDNQTFRFDKDTVYIGRREGNDIQLAFPFVSGRHCMIQVQRGTFFIQDLGSTNGTLVNGQLLQPQTPQRLGPTDKVQIGSLEVRVDMIQDATIIEPVPDLEPSQLPAVQSRTRGPVETAGGPSAMWKLQTGLFSLEPEDAVQQTPKTTNPVIPQPRSVDFEHSVILRRVERESNTPGGISQLPWGLVFQLIGLAIITGAVIILLVILFI